MNLAFLIGHFPPGPFGGAEAQAQGWARRLTGRHRVTVIARRDSQDQVAREMRDGFEVVRLPVARIPLLRTMLDLRRIEATMARLDPRPDLTLCFQTFVSGFAGVHVQRRLRIPAVVWIRGEGEYRLEQARARAIGPPVWRAARGVLVQSEGIRVALLAALRRHAAGLEREVESKIEVVPNALDLPAHPIPDAGARARRGCVLGVGRLVHEKGWDIVVDAVAGAGGRLTIAGIGPERARLEARAARRRLEVRFEGFVAAGRLAQLYREAGCVVLAARHGEGLPNVVLEAMSWGAPVIATRVAGVIDLVQDGANGLLVPPDDALALRNALTRLSTEAGLAGRIGRAGRATAEAFAWERIEPRLEASLERWRAR